MTVAIGDATGHGLKAGMMVTATKSLFAAHHQDAQLGATLTLFSGALKQMRLRGLFMALCLARVTKNSIRFASAGMPPCFVFRAATGAVDEYLSKTLPLGSLQNYSYREYEIPFQSGDILLLLSDGLPERFRPAADEARDAEMLGYEPIQAVLRNASTDDTPAQLIEYFVTLGEAWSQHAPQEDDITIVVVRASEGTTERD